MSNQPKPGDRVRLIGDHKYHGFKGLYLRDAVYFKNQTRPVVKIETYGMLTFVQFPERQMVKVGK